MKKPFIFAILVIGAICGGLYLYEGDVERGADRVIQDMGL